MRRPSRVSVCSALLDTPCSRLLDWGLRTTAALRYRCAAAFWSKVLGDIEKELSCLLL